MTSDSDAISERATATAMTVLRVTNPTTGMNQARYHGSNHGEHKKKDHQSKKHPLRHGPRFAATQEDEEGERRHGQEHGFDDPIGEGHVMGQADMPQERPRPGRNHHLGRTEAAPAKRALVQARGQHAGRVAEGQECHDRQTENDGEMLSQVLHPVRRRRQLRGSTPPGR